MRRITAPELARWLAESPTDRPLLLDVREPWEIDRAALDGILAIPMHEIPAALAGLDSGRTTVCICHHGGRSEQVARFLEAHGFVDVVNLTGGMHAWSLQVDASVPTY